MGYLIGSFPTGVVISLNKYGIDVRDMGSGNIGATNITRNFGWRAGVITFLVDFMKGFVGLQIAESVCAQSPWVVTATGAALVFGHCFSVFLRLRGGKGVATTLGCLVAVLPWAGFWMALSYLFFLITTRISAIGSLVGVTLACAYASVYSNQPPVQFLVYAMTAIVFVRHRTNIARLWTTYVSR